MKMRRGRGLPSKQRALVGLPIWLASMIWLWTWWFNDAREANLYLFIPLSFALLYEYALIPGAFMFFLLKAKVPGKRKPLSGKKVAVITPCVPSQESLGIIERQLDAMSKITYPHDSWILDEGASKDIKKLARKYGVRYFTRKGAAKYNQDVYPFKAKTKAGNINAWLHRARNQEYDFFVQLDIDHLPKPNYLDKTLGHFRDNKVAWVQAPSVYGNLKYWTARGSAEQELGFQGPLQMGFYGYAESPVIVGSHTTFRMKAIREIDGFQQTRAEDHLNTLALIKRGWKGVYLPEVIAEGDGPETFSAYLSQQYAWAFSMFQILKTYSFKHLKSFSRKKRLQYLFIQTWYPLSALSYCVMFLVPVLGLLFNTHAIHSTGSDFLYRFTPAFGSVLLMWWAGKPLYQPQSLNLSWRGMILHVTRWPIIMLAIVSAGLGRVKPYQITPKGKFLRDVPTVKLYRPFLILSLASASAILFWVLFYGASSPNGLIIFASANLVTMLSVCLYDLNHRLRSVRLKPVTFRRYWLRPTMSVSTALLIASISLLSAVNSSQVLVSALSKRSDQAVIAQVPRDTRNVLPQFLTDDELKKELSSHKIPNNYSKLPTLGLYTRGATPTEMEPYIRHTFIDWREDWKLKHELLTSLRQGHTPFITVEPKGETDGAKLLQEIKAGHHNQTIGKLLDTVSHARGDVYIRFAHEMDLADLYPWGNQDPALYIEAYRHITDLARSKHIKNIKWVWGSAGTTSASDYYPGHDVVDVVGATVLYDTLWSQGYQPSFYELAEGRLHLLQFGKPVWITEFGAGNTDTSFQEHLTREAISKYKEYGFSALIYVNIPDSNIPGPNYEFSNIATLYDILGIKRKVPNRGYPDLTELLKLEILTRQPTNPVALIAAS